MFSVCKQSHPATGIEFSISCRFFNNLEENIVTAGANILKVFRIVPDIDPHTTEKFTGKFNILFVFIFCNSIIIYYHSTHTHTAT